MRNEDKQYSKIMERAQKKAAQNDSFIRRNYWLWTMVRLVIYPLAAIISGLTEGGTIYMRLNHLFSDPLPAWIGTVVLVLLIEVSVFFFGKGLIDDIQAGAFHHGNAQQSMVLLKGFVFVAVFTASVSLSVTGAPDIVREFRKDIQPVEASPAWQNIDHIQAGYDAKVAALQTEVEKTRELRLYSGRITREDQNSIDQIRAEISRIEAQRDQDITIARQKNAQLESEWREKTENSATIGFSLSAIGQVIIFGCLIFIGLFDDQMIAETRQKNPHSPISAEVSRSFFGDPTPPETTTHNFYAQDPNTQRKPPGFFQSSPPPEDIANESQNQLTPHNFYAQDPTTPRQPAGFFQSSPPPQVHPEQHAQKPVATGGHPPRDPDTENLIYSYAKKQAQKRRKAWENKNRRSQGSHETNTRHIAREQAIEDYINRKLNEI